MLGNAEQIFKENFLLGFKPKERLTVSEWADKYRMLSTKASAEPGRWRTDRTPYLKDIMNELSHMSSTKQIVVMKGSQIGMALSLDTRIPTPDGWSTMGDLKVGDKVYGSDGKECNIKFKSYVFNDHNCYEVTFNDGSKIKCDANHRWTVWDEKKYEYRKQVTLSTEKIAESYKIIRSTKKYNRNRYAIYVQDPIRCRKKKLPVDPYLLGVWLGDGNRHTGILYLNKGDTNEILAKINRKIRVRLTSENCNECLIDGFCTELRLSGLLKGKQDKEIPQIYLRASYNQRLELLKGLMDTDGFVCERGRCEYSTVDYRLYKTFYELLMSLGIKANVGTAISDSGSFKTDKTEAKPRVSPPRTLWRIGFTVFGINVFSLKRKTTRLKKTGRISETKKRRICKVEKIETVKTQCISVDSDNHLYLCSESFIPTHNTEAGLNWMAYVIDYDPSTMMIIWPSLPDAKKNIKLRVNPLIESTPALKEKISTKAKDQKNTTLFKDFEGGSLIFTGANSASGLRSVPAKFLFMDEADAYPDNVEGEGNPIQLALVRSRTFSKRKAFIISTPTFKGRSKIEKEFNISDQRYYYLPCPYCNEKQVLQFKNLQYEIEESQEGKKVTNVGYYCECCGVEIKEYQKTKMLLGGEWIAHNASSDIAGFHLSSLYSPVGWYSWHELCQDFVDAEGDTDKMITFTNTSLGETYEETGEKPQYKKIYENRETYEIGTIPNGVIFLTCAVDVQGDRLEAEVIGWGRGKQRWSIEYKVFPGKPTTEEVWDDLEMYISSSFPHANGSEIPIRLTAVDSGYESQTVYNFVRKFNPRRVIAIKGDANMPIMVGKQKAVDIKDSGKTLKRRGVMLWPLGVNIIKSELYGFLQKDPPLDIAEDYPAGYCHFPQYEMEYFKQLTAEEKRVTKNKKGYSVIEWVKTRDRNEVLDLHVYNRAAASIIGIDKLNETGWQKLEANIMVVKKLKKDENIKSEKKKHKRESTFW